MIQIIPNKRLENRVTIMYKGHPVASGIDFKNGYYEVIPPPQLIPDIDILTPASFVFEIPNRQLVLG
jgi:hypothetical protein